jgi:hypothetical protein
MFSGGFFGRKGQRAPKEIVAVLIVLLVVRFVLLGSTSAHSATHWVLYVLLTGGLVWFRWMSPWGKKHFRKAKPTAAAPVVIDPANPFSHLPPPPVSPPPPATLPDPPTSSAEHLATDRDPELPDSEQNEHPHPPLP